MAEVTGSNNEIQHVKGHLGNVHLFSTKGQILQQDHHKMWQVPVACSIFSWINSVGEQGRGGRESFDRHKDQSKLSFPEAADKPSLLEGGFWSTFCQVACNGKEAQARWVCTSPLQKPCLKMSTEVCQGLVLLTDWKQLILETFLPCRLLQAALSRKEVFGFFTASL